MTDDALSPELQAAVERDVAAGQERQDRRAELRQAALTGPTQEQLDEADRAEADKHGMSVEQLRMARKHGMQPAEYLAFSAGRISVTEAQRIDREQGR